MCTCGAEMRFFLQLASQEIDPEGEFSEAPGTWSSHGLMLGDVGTLYFFVCPECSPTAVQSVFECS